MAEQGVKHMNTIANEYKEYITERTRLSDNGIKLTAIVLKMAIKRE